MVNWRRIDLIFAWLRGRSPGHSQTEEWQGPSQLKAEDCKTWLRAAENEENPHPEPFNKLVQLVQHCWSTGALPLALCWSTLVALPKGNGEFRGIGLLEIVWKLIEKLIDVCYCVEPGQRDPQTPFESRFNAPL